MLRNSESGDASRRDIYNDLRAKALQARESGVLSAAPHEHCEVSGVVVDIPASGGTATLVALTDNTTSLYTSTGGGTIGAGEHAEVAAATHVLLASIQEHLDAFTTVDDAGLPPTGMVRFHVLADLDNRMTDLPEDAFWGRVDHPLNRVIAAAQGVISSIRGVPPPNAEQPIRPASSPRH
jgi:hypothetical protein